MGSENLSASEAKEAEGFRWDERNEVKFEQGVEGQEVSGGGDPIKYLHDMAARSLQEFHLAEDSGKKIAGKHDVIAPFGNESFGQAANRVSERSKQMVAEQKRMGEQAIGEYRRLSVMAAGVEKGHPEAIDAAQRQFEQEMDKISQEQVDLALELDGLNEKMGQIENEENVRDDEQLRNAKDKELTDYERYLKYTKKRGETARERQKFIAEFSGDRRFLNSNAYLHDLSFDIGMYDQLRSETTYGKMAKRTRDIEKRQKQLDEEMTSRKLMLSNLEKIRERSGV